MKPRAFRIHDRAALQRCAALLSQMLVSEERPLLVEVSEFQDQRTNAQNRLLHATLRDVAGQVEVDGKRFSQDAWKEHFRRAYLGTEEITLPSGEIVTQGRSTAKASVQEMTEAIDRFLADLASEYGYLPEALAA